VSGGSAQAAKGVERRGVAVGGQVGRGALAAEPVKEFLEEVHGEKGERELRIEKMCQAESIPLWAP